MPPRRPPAPPSIPDLLDHLRDEALDLIDDMLTRGITSLKASAQRIQHQFPMPPQYPPPGQGQGPSPRRARTRTRPSKTAQGRSRAGGSTGTRSTSTGASQATHYAVLRVTPDADFEVIKAAYRALAFKYHPDRNPGDVKAADLMRRVNTAWEVLQDPGKRAAYDRKLGLGR